MAKSIKGNKNANWNTIAGTIGAFDRLIRSAHLIGAFGRRVKSRSKSDQ